MEVAPDVITIVPWCGILRNMIVSHKVPCHTCGTSWTLFLVTPLALHTWHLSYFSDRVGQCLLPQTSNLATRVSTLGGLPNGLGTFRSGPACANIFLMRVNRKSLKSSYTHTRNEECSCWEWPGLRGERTVFSSTWMCDGWWSNCWPFCHPYPHSLYDGYIPSQFAALWLFLPHCRNYLPLGHCEYLSTCICLSYPATISPLVLKWMSPPFQFCCLQS